MGGAETMLYRLVNQLHGVDGQRHSVVSLTESNHFDFAALGVHVDMIPLQMPGAALQQLVLVENPDRLYEFTG